MKSKDAPILEIKNVSKTFDGVVHALKDVSIAIQRNEIVGVVGENGAGKSTLMKIMVGIHPPDKGEWYSEGEKMPFPKDPKEAAKRGVAIVYQEKGVVPSLMVYQYLFLGHEDKYTRYSKLCKEEMKEQANQILKEFNVECDIDDYMYKLPLSIQKMVEIAKAILSLRLEHENDNEDAIIILDEPTAPLNIEERRELFRNITRMKKNTSFVFVSHIMNEVLEFTDRIHVLRDGELVTSYDMTRDKVTEEDLFKVIVGKESLEYATKRQTKISISDEEVLSVQDLTKEGNYYDVCFNLHKGECIGIFGPTGSGKSEIIKTISGILSFDDGVLKIKGQEVSHKEKPNIRLARGVGYFSGETEKELFLNWPITKNISIVNIDKIVRKLFWMLNIKAEREMADKIMKKFNIKAPSVNTECYSLSGGSKQKVSVGKWFERCPDILLLEDPTIGIDVGAREDIYEATLEMKRRGISMILVSDDPKEYSVLCDKVIFIKDGRIQKTLSPEEFKEVMST